MKGPLIASFLLKHERKMTMLHARVKRNPYYPLNDTEVESNQKYLITMGFRKFYIKPIFSRCINGTDKTKFTKKIKEDYESHFYCSFYYYNYFPPAPFSIYKINHLNTEQYEPSPVMYGELIKCDPLHIILERIILCGYPYKINRRRCTVRYMFFDPKDIKFFKPIEVRTKMGLRVIFIVILGSYRGILGYAWIDEGLFQLADQTKRYCVYVFVQQGISRSRILIHLFMIFYLFKDSIYK